MSVMDKIEMIETEADKVVPNVAEEIKTAYWAADKMIDALRNMGKVEEAEAVRTIQQALGYQNPVKFFKA